MIHDYDYPKHFDHERACSNCGAVYDDRRENCPECEADERYEPDPDRKYDDY
jgi:predicted amidophosphoribosyltransferase